MIRPWWPWTHPLLNFLFAVLPASWMRLVAVSKTKTDWRFKGSRVLTMVINHVFKSRDPILQVKDILQPWSWGGHLFLLGSIPFWIFFGSPLPQKLQCTEHIWRDAGGRWTCGTHFCRHTDVSVIADEIWTNFLFNFKGIHLYRFHCGN